MKNRVTLPIHTATIIATAGIILGLSICLLGCGGESTGPKASEDGRVFVENQTEYQLDVEFVNDDLEEVKTVVPPHATKVDVSQSVLTGGKRYTFSMMAHCEVMALRGEVEMEVNGSATIQIYNVNCAGGPPVEYRITGG